MLVPANCLSCVHLSKVHALATCKEQDLGALMAAFFDDIANVAVALDKHCEVSGGGNRLVEICWRPSLDA
jgi:hypothetical protein